MTGLSPYIHIAKVQSRNEDKYEVEDRRGGGRAEFLLFLRLNMKGVSSGPTLRLGSREGPCLGS